MKETTTVTYQVVSSEGHTEEKQDAEIALQEIENLVENESKWLYINKEHVADVSSIGIDELIEADNIMLTNLQVGG